MPAIKKGPSLLRFTGTEAFQHQARKKQEGEKDLKEKFLLINILRKKFNLYGLTGEVLKIGEDSYRLPDILVKTTHPQIVIELDGLWHQNGDLITKKQHDIDRDFDYQKLGVKLIVINEEVTKGYKEDLVEQILRENL